MNNLHSQELPTRFYLLGDVHVSSTAHEKVTVLPRSAQALLGYLLIYRDRYHSREVLADRLWGEQDPERARLSLNTALWRLRNLIGQPRGTHQAYFIQSTNGSVKFNTTAPYWLDLEMVEAKLAPVLNKRVEQLCDREVSDAEAALNLYRGDLLETNNSTWALAERERARALYIDGLAVLAEFHAYRSNYASSLTFGHKALRLEPLREDIHRIVMEAYAGGGRYGEALRHFESCRRLLREELDIVPAQETRVLHQSILGRVMVPGTSSERPVNARRRGTTN